MQASETEPRCAHEQWHDRFDSRNTTMDDADRGGMNPPRTSGVSAGAQASPWLTVREAADRARCGVKLIYREVRAKRLRAARVGGRRELRLRAEWIDSWLDAYTGS